MEKLFKDSEILTKLIPTEITQQQKDDFYKSIAQEIIENRWSHSDLEDIISDVSRIYCYDNGYEIAKSLEGCGSEATYKIDTSFIEFLDNFGYEKDSILRQNVEAWVLAHNPILKFKKGQKLMIEITLNHEKRKGEIVYVTGFDEKRACYLIDEDENRNGGTVIAYDKVEANCNPL